MPDEQSMQPVSAMQPAEPMHSMPSDLGGATGDEDVAQLAEMLRAAERAYAQHVAELRQADVEPAEDSATWYAEYLLGVR
jgi:hypothetical protein